MAEEIVLCLLDRRVHGLHVGRLSELLQQGGAMREKAKTREDVQVKRVVRAADEEEEIGARAVLRAEEDGTHGTSECKKSLLEEIGVVVARMEEGDAPPAAVEATSSRA